MSEFKERALLRTQSLRDLLLEQERERDAILDQIAHNKGRLDQIERSIKRLYEIVLDINKEEQAKELEKIHTLAQEQKEAFERAKRGLKTPKTPRKE